MSDLHINTLHDDERRKKRKRVAAGFFVSVVVIVQHTYCRGKIRELDDFSEDEAKIRIRSQMLRSIYQGSNKHCFDSLRLTKRSFVDMCAILRERCGLGDAFYVPIEESITMFQLVLSHGMEYRLIERTYRWALETISRHFNEILRHVLSLYHEFIKLPRPSAEQPDDSIWKWFPNG
ncbi:hypothetical protein VPH35_028715 [Triticum aestivum]|uniref:DUF8040 domain-containing protein n=1 Tax=Triticum turgidum subsp. durum TaxID=4567 RepID=A0A9R1PM82_TRITD|nr:unnamed protein product [Triticum turgidum subsp. durum]